MKNRKLKATDYLFHICNYGVFAILTLLCAYPFYYLIINSVSANDLSANGAINLIPRGIHLRNYLEVFKLLSTTACLKSIQARLSTLPRTIASRFRSPKCSVFLI